MLKGKTKIVRNMISINVYFGYNFNFFVIKILSVHVMITEISFCILSQLIFVSMCREKSMCLLQHKGNGNAVFVFVAAGRHDQAPQSVPRSAIGHLSLNHSL